MNRKETTQIIALLAGNYNSIAEKDKTQKQLMLQIWQECLEDLDYKTVLQAVKMSIISSPYPPTIHEIRKNAMKIIEPDSNNTNTPIEAWNEAYKMICRGTYMTQEEFDRASDEVKAFFGTVNQVRELARANIDTVNTVTKGQFLKQYEILADRKEKDKLLPSKLKESLNKLSQQMDMKQIEGV